MPTLETPRLVLRPIAKPDLNTLYEMLTDASIRRYLCDDAVLPLAQVEAMLSQSIQQFQSEKFGLWFIETKSTQETIGLVGLWYFFEESQPQLLYALLPAATQQGYATEAAARILDYSFNELGYEWLTASCDRPNVASQKVAKRLGMQRKDDRIINNHPIVFFEIQKPQES